MRLFAVCVFVVSPAQKKPVLFASGTNFNDLWFWARGSAVEGAAFCCQEMLAAVTPGQVVCTKVKDEVNCIGYLEPKNTRQASASGAVLAAAVVASTDYEPIKVAGDLCIRAIAAVRESQFYKDNLSQLDQFPVPSSLSTPPPNSEASAKLNALLQQHQVPENVDKVLKIQVQLEETKKILFQTMEQLLARQEGLDELLKKTEQLSFKTKVFAEKSKELNRCCTIL